MLFLNSLHQPSYNIIPGLWLNIHKSYIKWHTHQNMPDIFIDSLKAAEANADPEQPLAAPHVARYDGGLPHCQSLAAV